jgi:hypothetical protein
MEARDTSTGADSPSAGGWTGRPDPLSFVRELEGFDEHAVTRVMRDNARELLSL